MAGSLAPPMQEYFAGNTLVRNTLAPVHRRSSILGRSAGCRYLPGGRVVQHQS